MEFVIENYILRATEDGKIERFWKANKRKPDRWKELKGSKHTGGYLRIRLFLTSGKRNFKVHRLVYLAYNQEWNIYDEKQQIDHDDGNRTNNKIGNLRVVTNQQNQFNRHTAKGYYFDKERGKYKAQIQVDRKQNYIGSYDTPEEARQAYLAKKATLHTI